MLQSLDLTQNARYELKALPVFHFETQVFTQSTPASKQLNTLNGVVICKAHQEHHGFAAKTLH
jgi:hypothetical protein